MSCFEVQKGKTMRIIFGCDPNAAELKKKLIKVCRDLGHDPVDMGSDDPIYTNTAIAVAEAVVNGVGDRGVLVCGTGLGMSIAANKVKGAYAALLTDVYSAKRAVLSNNSNIACMGSYTIGEKLAEELFKTWIDLTFDPASPSQAKVMRYCEYDQLRG